MARAQTVASTRPARILFAEDDPSLRGVLRVFLRREGYLPVECADGKSAASAVRSEPPDLIILDANLGDISGFELCAALMRAPDTARIPVLMISGVMTALDHRDRALKLGAVDYLRKPLDLGALKRVIQLSLADKPVAPPAHAGVVLVADDEEEWRGLVETWLGGGGYEVHSVADEHRIFDEALSRRPDCLVLDYRMRSLTAADICRQLQGHPDTRCIPVIVLTSHQEERLRAAYKGADHFVFKDGRPEELLAAVHVAVRRRELDSGVLSIHDLKLDPRRHSVRLGGRALATLTPPQFTLLYALAQSSPKPLTRAQLYSAVLPEVKAPADSNALEQLLQRLKHALGEPVAARIATVKGTGWLYDPSLRLR